MTSYKNWIVTAALGVVATIALSTASFASEGDNVGDTQMCIDSHLIDDTPIIDSETILVRMVSPANSFKRIDLARKCPGLNKGTGFAYDTSIAKLCKQDTLAPLNSSGVRCIIDQIVTIDAAEARTLMER